MTDEEVDQILREISAEESDEGSCRWRNSISNREALEWAARAIVETLRQIRDRLPMNGPRDPSLCPRCHDDITTIECDCNR